MADLLDFGAKTEAPAEGTKKKNPPAKLWVNVGVWVDLPNPDGSVTKEFVGMPLGIPLDQLEITPPRGDNPRWNKIVATRNMMLTALQNKLATMEPGTQDIVNGLSVQVSRAKDKVEASYDATESAAVLNISFG